MAFKSPGYKARGRRRTATMKPFKAGLGSPKASINRPKANRIKPGLGDAPAKRLGAPAAKAAPVGQAPEFDAGYYNTVDTTDRKEQSSLGQLEGQEQAVKHEFGIEDPTNPFSRANGLKQAFLARQKAASAGLAAEGQLYTGTHERALSRTRRQEEQARAELRSAYEAAIGGIGAQKAGVKFASEEERNQAFEDWLARAPEADVPVESLEEVEAPTAAPPPAPKAGESPVAVSSAPQPTTRRKPARRVGIVKQHSAGLGQPTTSRPKVKPKPRPKVRKKGRRG